MIRINFSISKVLSLIRFHSIQPFLRLLIPSLSSFIKFFVYFHQKSNTRVRIQIIECEKLSKSTQLHTCLTSFLRFKFFLNFDSFKKEVMQFDVGDKMCWWQLEDVGDGFDHFGNQHPLFFYISLGYQHSTDVTYIKIRSQPSKIVTNFKSPTSHSIIVFLFGWIMQDDDDLRNL